MANIASDPGHGGHGGNSGNSGGTDGSGAAGVSGPASAMGPGIPFDNDATLDLARRVRAAMARESIDGAGTAAAGAPMSPEAYKDKLAAALADAVVGWLMADGRSAIPGLRAESTAPASPRPASERMPGNGGAASQPGDAGASPRGQPAAATAAAAGDGKGELSEAIGFLGNPGAPTAEGAAGIGKLGEMLRGWRKQRLLPDPDKEVSVEVAIGRDESLDAAFLELLAGRRRAVGIVRTRGMAYNGSYSNAWSGTCSLVAPNILLTNHHVLNSPDVAAVAEVAFDFEVSAQELASGRNTVPAPGRSYLLRPEQLFVTSPTDNGLDYTFVWIDDAAATGATPLSMERAAFAIESGEKAFIIHHPNGKPKRVSLDDTDVVSAHPDGPLIHYTTDTEPGSSGAPVLDRSGRLIALHHASRRDSERLRTPEGVAPEYVNEGIKLAAIALDLESRRAGEASAMIDMVLGEIYGSDTLTGFFGAAGRQVGAVQAGAARVAELYGATDQDLDVGFWNIAPFAGRYTELAGDAAARVVDLGLDLWALGGTSPAATTALVQAIESKFGLQLQSLPLPDGAPQAQQSGAVMWNPETVECRPQPWPEDVGALFRLRGEDFAGETQPAPGAGDIFLRQPALFQVRGRGGLAFNLVPFDLGAAAADRGRRNTAAYILSRAIQEMIEHHGASHDWLLGGGFDAESTNASLAAWAGKGYTPASAQDEAGAALSYLKCPGSGVGQVFLSPNLSRLYGPQDVFRVSREKSQADYLSRFGEHRPLLLRLSARGAGAAPDAHPGQEAAFNARIDAALRRARG
ncbi:trypsin-like serine peptidase [Massilia brevitalea]|uniref:trypsin-like serine peptidase n=1 Tax=Massilia brevitalea TaxID=442526 RepID=UPI0027384304|nr:serine protease [Massilia brevitalea]